MNFEDITNQLAPLLDQSKDNSSKDFDNSQSDDINQLKDSFAFWFTPSNPSSNEPYEENVIEIC